MAKVVLVRCETYEYQSVKAAVRKGLELLGGIERFIQKDEKILLKPNLLFGDDPEKCINTHPGVFKAVAEVCLETGADLSYGDHPGFGSVNAAARKTGIGPAAEGLGIPLADFKNGQTVKIENPLIQDSFLLANGVLESDGIISLPKLKTHALEKMTGAVKNQFGCVPGLTKPGFHVKYPDARDFGKMLVDLTGYIKPRLYIMDGIQGMEGNGPRGGDPVQMNVLLFSDDPIALDATVCRLVHVNPEFVPTIFFGSRAGLGTYDEKEIELAGDDIGQFINPRFQVNRERIKRYKDKGAFSFLTNLLVAKPVIEPEKCVACGVCVEACPTDPKSVNWTENGKKEPPMHHYSTCIRCYCCQEMCPEGAIRLKHPFKR